MVNFISQLRGRGGVNDEDPILPLAVKGLLYAFRKTHEPKARLVAAT